MTTVQVRLTPHPRGDCVPTLWTTENWETCQAGPSAKLRIGMDLARWRLPTSREPLLREPIPLVSCRAVGASTGRCRKECAPPGHSPKLRGAV